MDVIGIVGRVGGCDVVEEASNVDLLWLRCANRWLLELDGKLMGMRQGPG